MLSHSEKLEKFKAVLLGKPAKIVTNSFVATVIMDMPGFRPGRQATITDVDAPYYIGMIDGTSVHVDQKMKWTDRRVLYSLDVSEFCDNDLL